MRNILQYPITADEVVGCLERLHGEAVSADRVGDMTALLLQTAIRLVHRYGPEYFDVP